MFGKMGWRRKSEVEKGAFSLEFDPWSLGWFFKCSALPFFCFVIYFLSQ